MEGVKGVHLIIIGLLVVIIFLVWPAKKSNFSGIPCLTGGVNACPSGYDCAPDAYWGGSSCDKSTSACPSA